MCKGTDEGRRRRKTITPALLAVLTCLAALLGLPVAAGAATGSATELFPISGVPVIKQFPTTAGTDPAAVTAGPDDNIWFTDVSSPAGDDWGVGRMTFTGQNEGLEGTVANFSKGIVSAGPAPHGDRFDITAGPDGSPDHNLWFTEFNSGKIGRITPKGVVSEFQVTNTGLFSIATGPDGNLWATDVTDRDIYRIQPSKCSASLHDCNDVLAVSTVGIPGLSGNPGSIVSGPNGNLWFTIGGSLAEITTRGLISPVSQGITGSTVGDSSQSITVGPQSTLWFAEPSAGELGQVRFCSTVLCGAVIKLGGISGELSGSLRSASKIGILVARDERGRLVRVGRVPLGYHRAGQFAVLWNLDVQGHRLPSGRYVITLRARDHLGRVVDETRAAAVTVP